MGPSDRCILELHRTFRWLASSAERRRHAAGVNATQLEALGTRAADEIADLLRECERQLHEARSVDRPGLLEVASQVVAETEQCPRSAALVLTDVPIRSATDARFIEALIRVSSSAVATIPLGDDRTHLAFRAAGVLTHAGGPSSCPHAWQANRRSLFGSAR